VIKRSGKQIPQVVKLWVEQYEKDSKPAMVELLTMLFEACGAKFRIQGEFLDETNVDDVVVALVNMAAQGTIEDFQSSKKKEFRSFKENLVSFWDNLVSECQNGPLFDQVLFDKCMDYVIALSCTPPRVYRQVASLVGLQMVTSFIGVAKILGAQRQTMQRQLTAEKKKTSDGPHIESLNKRLSETHEKITMIEEMMRKIFTGLFVRRYRDLDPDIRMSCIQSLGAWIVSYPSLFLQDLYLKYLGWTLNDKSAGVRKASILALQAVYDVDDYVPSLGPFTLRFYKRMLDLADDNDIDWKRITSMLLDENPSIELTDDDATNLTRLFCASVKKAVGERIVPAIDHRKPNHTKAQKEMIESSKKNITVCMIKNYPQLMLKYMADKAKVPSLVEIIVHMDLELYSLKSQDQKFKAVLQLMKETFFEHGDKDALRSCVRAINYCSSGSRGGLKDYAQNKLKEVEDELVLKVKSAIREVADGYDEYLLLVNMKRLYELQLTRPVQIEDLYANIIAVVGFLLLNMYLHVTWCLHSIMNSSKAVSEESLSSLITSLITKRNELYEQLDYFLQILLEAQGKGTSRNLLACRVCTILAELWCLFKKSLYTSSKVERLGYQPAISTLRNFWKLCEYQLDISDETEEEDANKEYVEETNRDAIMIAAAKLVASGAVHKEYLAPDIISHCVMHGATVAEVVKHLVTSIRKREADVSDIFLEAMKQAHARYLAALSTSNDESLSARRLKECKDLASRLSSFFVGPAREESSAVILKIVKAGIDYAFTDAPHRLSFLTCAVINFASKLPRTGFYDILYSSVHHGEHPKGEFYMKFYYVQALISTCISSLKNLQGRTRNINTDEDPSGWRPYLTFVDTLREKSLKKEGQWLSGTAYIGIYVSSVNTSMISDEREGTSVKRRGRPPKKQQMEGKKLFDENSSSEEEDEISDGPDEEMNQVDEDEDMPLMQTLASAKLRALRTSREENRRQASRGEPENLAASTSDNAVAGGTVGVEFVYE
ncbi:sister-chromatid cohesion protein 3, partial [Tanacetum coccineum]